MSSICYAVFVRLSGLLKRLTRTPEFVCRAGDGKQKCRTTRLVRLYPQTAPVGIDDRSANRQTDPHAAGLCRVESLENALELLRINSRPRIAHGDSAVCLP